MQGRLRVAAILTALVWSMPAIALGDSATLAGRRLEDALRILQARGLRIVFSSELVTPDKRVGSEPRAKTARGQLAEILEPHGLAAEDGPGGVIQIVRGRREPERRPERGQAGHAKHPDGAAAPQAPRGPFYREELTVSSSSGDLSRRSVPSRSFGAGTLREFGGHIADDPLRMVQSLPGVAAADDFRAEYSVRGSRYRHAGLVVDGVAAPWLLHAAPGREHAGTLTMLRGDVIGEATLLVGAYPRHDGGQLGPQVSLSLREGDRSSTRLALGISGTTSTMTAEGPLGRAKRGAWLVGLRKSHVEWPVGRSDHDATVFGYADVQSKLVYDIGPGQQAGLSVVAGVSNVERDDPAPLAPGDGVNRAALASLFWRSTIGSHTVLTHRVSLITHEFLNRVDGGRQSSRGANRAQAYRADMAMASFGGVIEAGAQIRRAEGSMRGWGSAIPEHDGPANDVGASWLERSGYASFRRSLPGGVALDAGARLADSSWLGERALDRWLQVEWAPAPGWLLHGSTGVAHQFAALDGIQPKPVDDAPRTARAAYIDLGVGSHPSRALRWDVTLFARQEHDGLRGFARGVELMVEGRTRRGFGGWAGYSYGVARYIDQQRRESFPADFDQRQTFTLSGSAPLPRRARAGVTFRAGSNFPIPGYFTVRDGRVRAGERRNEARLPAYARLDVRVDRTFILASRRFTLFGELLNVLNRANAGAAVGAIAGGTGEAGGLSWRLYPRLFTAGLHIGF
jgi:hypothetical protein